MEKQTPLTVDRLLNDIEAARALGLHPQTLRNWRHTKLNPVPYIKLGGKVLYRVSQLEKYLDQNTVGAVK